MRTIKTRSGEAFNKAIEKAVEGDIIIHEDSKMITKVTFKKKRIKSK